MLELDGNWVFAWGVDDSNRSVGGTACFLALVCMSLRLLSCDSKVFFSGKALL
jgi:hypothetical protein